MNAAGSRSAARAGKEAVVVRCLKGPEEFGATEHVSRSAWGFQDVDISPRTDLVAATHCGGLTAGAFEGSRMLGFVHGIPRVNLSEPAHHSHLLAVSREAQGRGLGAQLKLFQRAWCLDRGIRLVTWTYDPFLAKNAMLNVMRLGGTVRTFLPNLYGDLGGIYARLPTDRFEVMWRLDSERVKRCARGEGVPSVREAASLPVAGPSRLPTAPRVVVPCPAGAPEIYSTDPEGSRRWRRRFERTVLPLFAAGYEVTAVEMLRGRPAYVLERAG